MALGLVGSVLVSFLIGRYPVPPLSALAILLSKVTSLSGDWAPEMEIVLLKIRLPRIIAAFEVGAALSASGAAYQGMFRNPLVSPDILGVTAGAGFGAALAILWSLDALAVQGAAFAFGLIAVAATSLIGLWRGRGGDTTLVMILAGVIVGMVFTSFISLVKFTADPNNSLPAITFWLMGSLAAVKTSEVYGAALPITIGLTGLILLRWKLNVLSFGDEEAKTMGIHVGRVRLLVIGCATLASASAVAIGGVIGLVGLVVPYLGRLLVGPDIWAACWWGRSIGSCCPPASAGRVLSAVVDDLARSLLSSEIPLGILTSLIGAPVFLGMLLKSRRAWHEPPGRTASCRRTGLRL